MFIATTNSNPVSEKNILFRGNILSVDGKHKVEIEKIITLKESVDVGIVAAKEILSKGADKIVDAIKNGK